MANSRFMYPTLTSEIIRRAGIEYGIYTASGNINNQLCSLVLDPIEEGEIYNISDKEGRWGSDDYFSLNQNYHIEKPHELFGYDGVACHDAELGIAIQWMSASSKRRGSQKIGKFACGNKPLDIFGYIDFAPGSLRGILELKTVLYISKKSSNNRGEEYFANEEGMIVGEISSAKIILDGNGSMFPIYDITEENGPLWKVKMDWEDPNSDQFSETVEICLNIKHPDYPQLDAASKNFNKRLLIEVLSSALSLIVLKLNLDETHWEETIQGKNLEQGSVSEAVSYFINNLGWNVTSPEVLSNSIHQYLEESYGNL